MNSSQLYRFAHPDFESFSQWTPKQGRLTRHAGTVPFVVWPDGHWCLEVNLFLSKLLSQGYACSPRGGTLGTYAAYLAPLIRYCYFRRRFSFQLADSEFAECVSQQYKETRIKHKISVNAFSRTTVRAMACVWLEFLHSVGEIRGNPSYVSKDGEIRGYRESRTAKRNGKAFGIKSWEHWSIAPADPYRYRMPMSETTLHALRDAASTTSRGAYAKRRRLVMLELFDAVGLRRLEAARLRVMDVKKAVTQWQTWLSKFSNNPELSRSVPVFMLSFRMVKQKDGNPERLRETPVSAVALQFFDEYLNATARLLRRLHLPSQNPEDPFFVDMRTGKALEPNFFTLEYWKLGRAANIVGPCSPHMARCRFIVREFIRLLQSHHMQNIDEFRRALVDSEVFKERVRQITGHASAGSLDAYIHFAVAELAKLNATIAHVDLLRGMDALQAANERFKAAVAHGEDALTAANELSQAVAAYSISSRKGGISKQTTPSRSAVNPEEAQLHQVGGIQDARLTAN